MIHKYLRAFVIGSSYLVFALYFYAVSNFRNEYLIMIIKDILF